MKNVQEISIATAETRKLLVLRASINRTSGAQPELLAETVSQLADELGVDRPEALAILREYITQELAAEYAAPDAKRLTKAMVVDSKSRIH